MTRTELLRAALDFVEDCATTCGDRDVDQERQVSRLFEILRDVHEAGKTGRAPEKRSKE